MCIRDRFIDKQFQRPAAKSCMINFPCQPVTVPHIRPSLTYPPLSQIARPFRVRRHWQTVSLYNKHKTVFFTYSSYPQTRWSNGPTRRNARKLLRTCWQVRPCIVSRSSPTARSASMCYAWSKQHSHTDSQSTVTFTFIQLNSINVSDLDTTHH